MATIKRPDKTRAARVHHFLADLRVLDLAHYEILPGRPVYKVDDFERQRLIDLCSFVRHHICDLSSCGGQIWYGKSGTGKSHLARELGESLKAADGVEFIEVNAARDSADLMHRLVSEPQVAPRAILFDEVDAKLPQNPEPLNVLFELLSRGDAPHPAFVIAPGSGGGSLSGIERRIDDQHPRGVDIRNRFLPGFSFTLATELDAMLIFVASALAEARKVNKSIHAIDKLALAYVALTDATPATHKLARLARTAVSELPQREHQLKYHCLFNFWQHYDADFDRAWRPRFRNPTVILADGER